MSSSTLFSTLRKGSCEAVGASRRASGVSIGESRRRPLFRSRHQSVASCNSRASSISRPSPRPDRRLKTRHPSRALPPLLILSRGSSSTTLKRCDTAQTTAPLSTLSRPARPKTRWISTMPLPLALLLLPEPPLRNNKTPHRLLSSLRTRALSHHPSSLTPRTPMHPSISNPLISPLLLLAVPPSPMTPRRSPPAASHLVPDRLTLTVWRPKTRARPRARRTYRPGSKGEATRPTGR
jgi:hypothetical protein